MGFWNRSFSEMNTPFYCGITEEIISCYKYIYLVFVILAAFDEEGFDQEAVALEAVVLEAVVLSAVRGTF
jgi:hypothetical protein